MRRPHARQAPGRDQDAEENQDPQPLVLGGWGQGGPPEDFDPGSPTGPFPVVDITPDSVPSPSRHRSYDREVVSRAKLVAEVSSGEGTELPHWADPPTGEIPRALAGASSGDEEMQAWRLLGSRGLHWRDDVNDWDDGPGVEELLSHGNSVAEHGGETEGLYSFDADFERLESARSRTGRAPARSDEVTVLDGRDDGLLGEGPLVGTDAMGLTSPGAINLPPPPAGPEVARSGRGRPGAEGNHSRRSLGGKAARDLRQEQGANVGRSNVKVVTPASGSPDDATGGPADAEPGPPTATGSVGSDRPYDVSAEGGMSRSGRDIGAAVTTGLAMAVVFVFCYVIGPGALLALAVLALLGCSLEAFAILQRAGFRPATLVGALGTVGAVLAAYWKGPGSLGVVVVLVAAASLVWYLARVADARPVVNAAVTTFAFAWVGAMGSFAGTLLAMPSGARLFAGAVVPTVIADMAAWFAGSRLGSHRIAPSVSPGKTWEGFFAGAVAAVVVATLLGSVFSVWGTGRGIVLGLMIAVVAPVGDLVQSMVKRDLRLKDSGALLPGHGGLLDRFDSLLFVLPATYFLVSVLHIA